MDRQDCFIWQAVVEVDKICDSDFREKKKIITI